MSVVVADDAGTPARARVTRGGVRLLNLLAQAGMFIFGLSMALIGAIVPALSGRLALTLGDVGTLFLAMNGAMLLASLVLGLIVDRFGLKLPLAAGAGLAALALWLFGGATQAAHLLPAAACLGFGGGLLNGGINTLVADLHDEPARKAAALNLLGMFFGVGALFLPFTLGALMARFGMRGLLSAVAALCLLIGIVTVTAPFPAAKQRQGGWPLAQMPRFIRRPIVLVFGFLLFFESGNEFALGGYISTFLTRDLALPIAQASYALAGFWASIMIARLVLSRVVLRLSPSAVIAGGALIAAAGALAIAAAGTAVVAIAGALVCGAALGGVFPTVLGLASARFHEHSGTVFGLLFAIALSGGMILPWMSGRLAEAAGLPSVFVFIAANFLAVALLAIVARRAS